MTASTERLGALLPPCEVLRELVRSRVAILPSGEERRLGANISVLHAKALYETALSQRPKLVIEIGMAQGISTLAIGKLISIDPYVNWKSGRDAALNNVRRAGFSDLHRHIEDYSFKALPQLIEQGIEPDFAYVDGAHDFANVFIDAFYLDKMLMPNGVLAFNDAGWRDVYRVIRVFERSGSYRRMDVGLARDFRGRNLLYTSARLVLRRSREDHYFRKLPER